MRIEGWQKMAFCACGKTYAIRVFEGRAFYGGKYWICPKCARPWSQLSIRIARWIKPRFRKGHFEFKS